MSSENVCIFVDGGNVFHSSRTLGIEIDLEKLRAFLTKDRKLSRSHYYGADSGSEKQRRFFYALKHIGWDVKTLPLRRYEEGTPFEKGIDVMLVTDMLVAAQRNMYDIAILVSGDKDYVYPVKTIKKLGKRVELASFDHSVSTELKLAVDRFISLTDNIDSIQRDSR